MKTFRMNEETFEDIRADEELQVGKYILTDESGKLWYAFSPDGIGCLWYDDYAAMTEDVG